MGVYVFKKYLILHACGPAVVILGLVSIGLVDCVDAKGLKSGLPYGLIASILDIQSPLLKSDVQKYPLEI